MSQRARIIASMLEASRSLPADPDAAALLLDGALSQMVVLWASERRLQLGSGAAALSAIERHSPSVAWRLRLALQAPSPVAQLAHCWALLDLLTNPTRSAQQRPSVTQKPTRDLRNQRWSA